MSLWLKKIHIRQIIISKLFSLNVFVQVYLMFNFINEAIKQRQEARQLAQIKPKKEKKEKPKKEKGKECTNVVCYKYYYKINKESFKLTL